MTRETWVEGKPSAAAGSSGLGVAVVPGQYTPERGRTFSSRTAYMLHYSRINSLSPPPHASRSAKAGRGGGGGARRAPSDAPSNGAAEAPVTAPAGLRAEIEVDGEDQMAAAHVHGGHFY